MKHAILTLSLLMAGGTYAQEDAPVAPVVIPIDGGHDDLIAYPSTTAPTPFVAAVLARTTNRFTGTATIHYTRVYQGTTTNWRSST